MAHNDDAYGQMMWDHYRGIPAEEIVEREDGYISAGVSSSYFKPYDEWPDHQQKAMAYAQGRVLDIGCGPGRHAIYLQEQGLDVLGIDMSPLAIRVAKKRGIKKGKPISITKISSRLGQFDTILMMGSNFGLFGNLKRARWLLRKMYNMTSPDARIIAESVDPYGTKRKAHLDYHKKNRKQGKFSCQLTIRVRYEKYIGPWFEYLKVSREEMAQVLEGTGWQVSKFIPEKEAVFVGIIEKV